MSDVGSNGKPFKKCLVNPAPDTVYSDIQIFLIGQLLLRYVDEKYVSVCIPDFRDDHHLFIAVFENSGDKYRIHQGPLDQDIWLQVEQPNICFYLTAGSLEDLQKDPTTYENDIRYIADFQGPNFHGSRNPLQIDTSSMQRTIFLESGSFYTFAKTKCKATKIGGLKDNDGLTLPDGYQVATTIGAKIILNGGKARLIKDDGTPLFDGLDDFSSGHPMTLVIANMPPFPYSNADKIISDFPAYYNIVKGIPRSERYGFTFDCDQPLPKKVPGFLEVIFRNDDVPCMPGGGGLP